MAMFYTLYTSIQTKTFRNDFNYLLKLPLNTQYVNVCKDYLYKLLTRLVLRPIMMVQDYDFYNCMPLYASRSMWKCRGINTVIWCLHSIWMGQLRLNQIRWRSENYWRWNVKLKFAARCEFEADKIFIHSIPYTKFYRNFIHRYQIARKIIEEKEKKNHKFTNAFSSNRCSFCTHTYTHFHQS